MKLSHVVLSFAAIAIGSAARAQIGAARPATTPPNKAQANVKQAAPVKHGPTKAQLAAQTHVQPSQPGTTSLLVGGSDNCATADPISGYGTFAVSTVGATGALSSGFCSTCNNDVWFAWTATASGNTQLSLCSGVTADSLIAVWFAGTCPPTALVICDDDFCSFLGPSQVTFFAIAGQTYLFELGAFSAAVNYTGTFTVQAPPPPPTNDDCTTPTALAGPSPYPFDNSAATTGTQGQAEPACLFFSSTTIDSDVWFTWTAPSSNPFRISTCGLTTVDTKIAVYDGAGCPITAALACNDDDCGLQSGAVWTAVAGNSYTIQLGTFPGALPGVGTFDISPFVATPGDDCATPVVLTGVGPYAYDNSSATTAPPGVPSPLCGFFSTAAIDNNLWFCWTAPSSGSFDLTTVGLTTSDTKVAVYDGCGCPAVSAIACNDDTCGTLQSTATFNAVGGNSYTFEIGNFPGASGAPGAFDVLPTPITTGCQYDDGTSENAIGLTAGGEFLWMQPFGDIGAQTLVTSVSAAYGTPLFPGGGPAVGTPVNVCVYDDPNDDGDATDAVLVSLTPGLVGNVDNDVLDTYAVPPALLNGKFFVGVALVHPAGQFPAALDGAYCGPGRTWVAGSTTAPFDYVVLTNNNVPPTEVALGGIWLVRAGCATSAGTSLCGNGDPNRIPCPCGNNGTNPDAGCANSLNPAGALLTTTGYTPTDDVVLHSTGMSGTICIFIRTLGPQQPNGAVFGDGVTCTGGSLLRLRAVSFVGGISGTASFPGPPPTITLSARSGTFPGSGATMQYASYYRNAAAGFCPPFTFNTSNTIEMTW